MLNLGMFAGASAFNQELCPLEGCYWNTQKVESMAYMFSHAGNFNKDLSKLDTSSVTSFENMFAFASTFDQPLGKSDNGTNWVGWDTGKVTTMRNMFLHATEFDQDISGFEEFS